MEKCQWVMVMKTLRIKDNALIHKEEFIKLKQLTEKISNKTLEKLEQEGIFVFPEQVKEAKDLTKDQMVLQSLNEYYRSGNVMGFLGYGKEKLVIESRFSLGKQDYFFQYLLETVLELPNLLDLHTSMNRDEAQLDLFVFLFPYYLKLAMRKGLYKAYQRQEYNDANVKGSIDVERHIRSNTPFIGKVAYHQREFSYDNYLMQLIRHTIECIKKRAYGKQLLGKVKDEVSRIIEVTQSYTYQDRGKIITENKHHPVRHAYYHEYGTLQRLCMMILQGEKQQIGSGVLHVHGMIFDGAWLWEQYVYSLIRNQFYHPMNKGREGAQYLFNESIGLIYPDFISKDNQNPMIADAKYKPFQNIGNKDYLQLLAYMFRFDAKKGFFLYPDSYGKNNLELMMNRGSTYKENVEARTDVKVIKCGLHIPSEAANYETFKYQIKESEQFFKQQLFNQIL